MGLVSKRSREGSARRPDPTRQHWSMLLFESLSAGVVTVVAGFAAVIAVLGLYLIIVWPLTFWDLSNLGLEQYAGWTNTFLGSVFAGGSLAGFWCFSGAAFRPKRRIKVPVSPGRSRP
jgi:hypothetical protein